MLESDWVGMSERIDTSKTKETYRCFICNYYYFLKINLRFQRKICVCCHDLIQKATIFDDATIVSIKENDYRIYLWYMSKD